MSIAICSSTLDDAALTRYAEGRCSLGELALALGMSRLRARAELGRLGIAVRSPGRPAGSSALARVLTEGYLRREHLEQGRSVAELADDLGCTRKTVRRYLAEFGIDRPADRAPRPPDRAPRPPDRAPRPPDWDRGAASLTADDLRSRKDPAGTGLTADDLRDLYLVRGRSTTAIAAATGCAPSTVARDLRRNGIPLRRPGGSPPPAVRRLARQASVRLGVLAADTLAHG